jgi:hypothetical protein
VQCARLPEQCPSERVYVSTAREVLHTALVISTHQHCPFTSPSEAEDVPAGWVINGKIESSRCNFFLNGVQVPAVLEVIASDFYRIWISPVANIQGDRALLMAVRDSEFILTARACCTRGCATAQRAKQRCGTVRQQISAEIRVGGNSVVHIVSTDAKRS